MRDLGRIDLIRGEGVTNLGPWNDFINFSNSDRVKPFIITSLLLICSTQLSFIKYTFSVSTAARL